MDGFGCWKITERHRRPPLDLRLGPFAPEFGDGFQVPPAGTLGTPLPLVGELGPRVPEDVPSMPFFGELGTHLPEDVPMPFLGEFGTHVPEGVPSMPFFGFASLLGLAFFDACWWHVTARCHMRQGT